MSSIDRRVGAQAAESPKVESPKAESPKASGSKSSTRTDESKVDGPRASASLAKGTEGADQSRPTPEKPHLDSKAVSTAAVALKEEALTPDEVMHALTVKNPLSWTSLAEKIIHDERSWRELPSGLRTRIADIDASTEERSKAKQDLEVLLQMAVKRRGGFPCDESTVAAHPGLLADSKDATSPPTVIVSSLGRVPTLDSPSLSSDESIAAKDSTSDQVSADRPSFCALPEGSPQGSFNYRYTLGLGYKPHSWIYKLTRGLLLRIRAFFSHSGLTPEKYLLKLGDIVFRHLPRQPVVAGDKNTLQIPLQTRDGKIILPKLHADQPVGGGSPSITQAKSKFYGQSLGQVAMIIRREPVSGYSKPMWIVVGMRSTRPTVEAQQDELNNFISEASRWVDDHLNKIPGGDGPNANKKILISSALDSNPAKNAKGLLLDKSVSPDSVQDANKDLNPDNEGAQIKHMKDTGKKKSIAVVRMPVSPSGVVGDGFYPMQLWMKHISWESAGKSARSIAKIFLFTVFSPIFVIPFALVLIFKGKFKTLLSILSAIKRDLPAARDYIRGIERNEESDKVKGVKVITKKQDSSPRSREPLILPSSTDGLNGMRVAQNENRSLIINHGDQVLKECLAALEKADPATKESWKELNISLEKFKDSLKKEDEHARIEAAKSLIRSFCKVPTALLGRKCPITPNMRRALSCMTSAFTGLDIEGVDILSKLDPGTAWFIYSLNLVSFAQKASLVACFSCKSGMDRTPQLVALKIMHSILVSMENKWRSKELAAGAAAIEYWKPHNHPTNTRIKLLGFTPSGMPNVVVEDEPIPMLSSDDGDWDDSEDYETRQFPQRQETQRIDKDHTNREENIERRITRVSTTTNRFIIGHAPSQANDPDSQRADALAAMFISILGPIGLHFLPARPEAYLKATEHAPFQQAMRHRRVIARFVGGRALEEICASMEKRKDDREIPSQEAFDACIRGKGGRQDTDAMQSIQLP